MFYACVREFAKRCQSSGGWVFSAGRGWADRSRAEEKSTPGSHLGSAMAAGDTATVFLETTLGTRFVVSFPAGATTVADLKGACLSISPHSPRYPR